MPRVLCSAHTPGLIPDDQERWMIHTLIPRSTLGQLNKTKNKKKHTNKQEEEEEEEKEKEFDIEK